MLVVVIRRNKKYKIFMIDSISNIGYDEIAEAPARAAVHVDEMKVRYLHVLLTSLSQHTIVMP